MKIPVRNVYYLLCYAWSHLEETDLVGVGSLDRLDRAQDLLGKVLAEGTFRLIRRGIDRGYREVTHEIPGVRGKLEIGAMATQATRARGRTICTYEEFSQDVLHNQILRSTLDLLLRTGTLDPSVRQDVALAYRKLEGVSVIRLTRQLFRRVQLDRNQRQYRFLLQVCQLVLESLLIDERTGGLRFHDFRRDKKQMWRVFEDFVREFYRSEQSAYRVLPERKIFWDGLEGRTPIDESYVPEMSSDILLESPTRRIILDTKFYRKPLSRRWGSEKLRSGNLYQLLTYLRNRQGSDPLGPKHEGILLYAAVDQSFRIDVELEGFRVQARTVDLSRSFQGIHRELLDILAEPGLKEEFIRVERRPSETVILVLQIDWRGPHTPVSNWSRATSLAADARQVEIDRAITAVLEDTRFFGLCSYCGEKNPVGWMHDDTICQGCAEARLGVVH